MKTAISLPDDLFDAIDACAKRMHVSRSRLLATAAREFLARRQEPPDATAAWNEVIAGAGQPGADPGARALRERSKARLRDSHEW